MYKPVILLGNGIRNNPALVEHLCSLGVPVMTTWAALDLVPEDCPAFVGRPGVFGQRASNIIQQMSDMLIVVGARLDGEQVAYDYDRFAPNATKYVYDVDVAELEKLPINRRWYKYITDLKHGIELPTKTPRPGWLEYCKSLYARFRPELDGPTEPGEYVDTFAFINALSDAAQPDDLLAIGSSSGAVNAFLQAFRVKQGQRVTLCPTIGAMGADIPMALGGCLASGRRTICVTGDGGFQLNAQELETIRRMNLPITFFVFNNGGYNSIRVMQNARFGGRLVGCNAESGLTLPPLDGLADAYGIEYEWLDPGFVNGDDLGWIIERTPKIVEVIVDPNWQQFPRVMASTVNGQLRTDDMQDMSPKLDPDELQALMEWDG